MYEAHFGLKSRPFGSKAEGAGIFVGPQQTKLIKSLQKGLGAADAIVTVTGPVGVGKTTMVTRALDSISPNRMAAWVGRMQLASEEVLDLLLAGFGVRQQAKGTIRRFAAFRRLLAERAAAGAPVVIIIEDAHRLGIDALAEIEALTAADTGDTTCANIILMGQPGLHKLLSKPDLARLKQRNRLRQSIDALSLAEVNGYLKHCIREAGGEYDAIFDNDVADIVFDCSEGIPRIINALCETALTSAMEGDSKRVSAALMHKVAAEAYGYDGPLPDAEPVPVEGTTAQADEEPELGWEAPPVAEVVTEEADEPAPAAKDVDEQDLPPAARNIVVESGCYPNLKEMMRKSAEPPAKPSTDTSIDTPVESEAEPIDDISELINDTQPELSQLKIADVPELAAADEPEEDTSTTAIQETISEVALKAPTDRVAEPGPEATAAANKTGNGDGGDKSDGNFDLDAALSIDVEETNVMEGITPNLDTLASEVKQADAETAAEPPAKNTATEVAPVSADDLPTLSDSMRVDVDKEVKRAKQVDVAKPVAAKPEVVAEPPPAVKPAPAVPVSELTARIAAIDPDKRNSDVDALEAALAAAKKGEFDIPQGASMTPAEKRIAARPKEVEAPASAPEITLDQVISDQCSQNAELDKFAAEIGNANSLEDMSDGMAETLFGSEDLDQIAAEVIANPPADHESADAPPEGPSPVALDEPAILKAANDPADRSPGDAGHSGPGEIELAVEAPPKPAPGLPEGDALKDSVAMRIDMLNSMKSKVEDRPTETVELGSDSPAESVPTRKGPRPEPIENQINTSMTQTLEALNVAKVAENVIVEEDKEEKKSGGLFSRFRKSS